MVKKKSKAKKEKKGKTIKNESDAEKTKGPTEKDIFGMKVRELREQLEAVSEHLHTSQEALEAHKTRLEGEADVAKACTSHLMRKLQRENEKREVAEERLQSERELGELAELRAQDKVCAVDENHEAARSLFRRQKMDLEGKLSLLEELRLTRNRQRTRLRRMEEALSDKLADAKNRTRQQDAKHVDKLLRKRQKFINMCRNIRTEWEKVFRLRMPVRAKKQLEDNVRLRSVCRDYTERLLQAQERSRSLKDQQKSLQLETLIQGIGEENAEKEKSRQENMLRHLLEVNQKLQSGQEDTTPSHPDKVDDENTDSHRLVQECPMSANKDDSRARKEYDISMYDKASKDTDFTTSSLPNEVEDENIDFHQLIQECPMSASKDDPRAREESDISVEDTASKPGNDVQLERKVLSDCAGEKTLLMNQCKDDICRVKDACRDAYAILVDQAQCKESLDSRFAECIDKNGVKMAAIVRAGKVFRDRCSKMEIEVGADLGFDVLHQIKMLLDLSKDIG